MIYSPIIKSLTAIALALSLSTAAHAGPYSDAVGADEFCQTVSAYSDHVWTGREFGIHPKQYYIDEITAQNLPDLAREAMFRAINYTFDKAVSSQDAGDRSWAACMDLANLK